MKDLYQKIKVAITRNKKYVSLGVVVIALVVGLLITLFDNSQQSDDKSLSVSKPTFQNYLKPSSEIKVGDNRYISPCQVLRLEDVTAIFGDIGGEGYVRENTYDSSPVPQSSLDREVETSCFYVYEDKKQVVLSAEQSFRTIDPDNLQFSLYTSGDEKMDEKIAMYERATNASNSELKSFVSELKQSVKTYNQISRSDEVAVDTSKFIVPVDRGLFSFNLVKDNVVYKIDYKIKESATDEFKLSDQEIADGLTRSYKTIELIKQRIRDSQLDQSPAPTILGDTEMVGNTKVLEPCAMLTSQLYQAVIGSPANEAITRRTVFQDIAKDRIATNGSPSFPDNECERNGRANDVATSMRLELNYGKSAAEVQAVLEKGFKMNGNDTLLQTNADWAVHFNVDASTGGYVLFRVGSYYGSVDILNTSSKGLASKIDQTGGNDQQYIQLINAAADYIKQQ